MLPLYAMVQLVQDILQHGGWTGRFRIRGVTWGCGGLGGSQLRGEGLEGHLLLLDIVAQLAHSIGELLDSNSESRFRLVVDWTIRPEDVPGHG